MAYEEREAVTDDNNDHCCDCQCPHGVLDDLRADQQFDQKTHVECTYTSENHVYHICVTGE